MPTLTPIALLAIAAALLLPAAVPAADGSGGLAPAPVGPPASDSGAHANIRRTPGESAEFSVPATNGYTLQVKSEKGMVTIIASRQRPSLPTISPTGQLLPANDGAVAESTYAVRGAPRDPSVIRADFGRLGSISVAFHPAGKQRVTNFDLEDKTEECVGAAKVVRRLGTFTGNISFQAENGYTAAELGSAPGTLGTSPFRNCSTLPTASGRGSERPTLSSVEASLSIHGAAGASSFFAYRDTTGSDFFAVQAERLSDDLIVLRRAQAPAPASAFAFAADASSATVRPPAPFAGSATYRSGPQEAAIWTGGLSVEFPGLRMPLTGPSLDPPKLRLFSTEAGR